MSFPANQQAYGATNGTTPVAQAHVDQRDPLSSDINWPVMQLWLNQATQALWQLNNFQIASGYQQAVWVNIGAGGVAGVQKLSGNAGIANPVLGNINVLGNVASGISTQGLGNSVTATLANIPNSSLSNSTIGLNNINGLIVVNSPVSLGGTITIGLQPPVAVTNGGTGQIIYTDGQLLIGDGTTSGLDRATLTAAPGGGISIVNGPGSITLSAIGTGVTTINRQTFSSSGVYTPSAGMVCCDVEVLGGGGAGSLINGGGATAEAGSGGGAGGYARSILPAATIGGSQVVTVGVGGDGPSQQPGGTTSFGLLVIATGGSVGTLATSTYGATEDLSIAAGAAGGIGTVGQLLIQGCSGGNATANCTTGIAGNPAGVFPGYGGAGFYGGMTSPNPALVFFVAPTHFVPGTDATCLGSGGSGAEAVSHGGGVAGGSGFHGICIVTEYIAVGSLNPALLWVDVTTTPYAMLVDTGYAADGAGLITLDFPAIAPFGSVIEIAGKGAGGWRAILSAGQTLEYGSVMAVNYIESNINTDYIRVVCTTANTVWTVTSSIGNPSYS